MVIIRLSRKGSKNRPFYQITVSDRRNSRDGKFIENIGYFNPILKKNNKTHINLNLNRINYWISCGAQISNRVNNLLKKFKNN